MNTRLIVAAVIEKEDNILLCRKPKDIGPYPNTWNILGGGVNTESETLMEAVEREVKEETNLEIDNIRPVHFGEDTTENWHNDLTHFIFLIFRCQYKDGTLKPGDDISVAEWVKKSEVMAFNLNMPTRKLFTAHPELLIN